MRKRRSYFKVPNALIFDTTLSFATRRVGMIFFAYCNALGGCRKSYEAIAALAGCSVATAVKAVWEILLSSTPSTIAASWDAPCTARTPTPSIWPC